MALDKKNIIFDLDGTLIDSFPGISLSFRHTLQQLGLEDLDDEQIRLAIGPGLHKALESLLNTQDPQIIQKAVDIYRAFHDSEGYKHSKIYSGILELLESLKASDFKLFVASMKSDHIIKPILEYLELQHYFVDAIGSNKQGLTSSKAQMLIELAKKYCFEVNHAILVGDTLHDARAAKAANMDFFAVTYGYGLVSELQSEPYSKIFDTVYQIQEHLEKVDAASKG